MEQVSSQGPQGLGPSSTTVGPTAIRVSGSHGPADCPKRLVLILSTHVDDFKGVGEEEYRFKLLVGLEKEFSALKFKNGKLECVGVMHEQDPQTFEAWAHQQHYIPQINAILVDAKALAPDDEPADDDMKQLFMSLVGAFAWLILTMPAICIYVAFLQRQCQAPTIVTCARPTDSSGGYARTASGWESGSNASSHRCG